MAENKYTLRDKIFRDGMYFSALASQMTPSFPDILLVGGGASQMMAHEYPHLLRPTTDIDVIPTKHIANSHRKAWAKKASEIANSEGYKAEGKIGLGGEVRFLDMEPVFLLHLDCFSKKNKEESERRAKLEYTRSNSSDIRGVTIKYQRPEDNIAKKVARSYNLLKTGSASPNTDAMNLFRAIEGGDVLDTSLGETELAKILQQIERTRRIGIEDLARESHEDTMRRIADYKVEKDIYDIRLVLFCQKNNIDPELLRESLKDLSVRIE